MEMDMGRTTQTKYMLQLFYKNIA